jgi:hypothetical protein
MDAAMRRPTEMIEKEAKATECLAQSVFSSNQSLEKLTRIKKSGEF